MNDATGRHRALTIENRELRERLAEAQDLLVKTAIDARHLHARIEALQDELRGVRAERDALLGGARRQSGPAVPHPFPAYGERSVDRNGSPT